MIKVLMMLLLIFVSVAYGQIATKTANEESRNLVAQTSSIQRTRDDCVTMNFHYLELENYSYATSTLKHIEVFLDEKAFSEENLRTLFAYLSKKYSEPNILVIVVHTNWAQLDFPSDCPGSGMSNMPARPDEYDYHQAIYYRREKVEYFRYNPALGVDQSQFKIVVLKGKQTSRNE